MKRWSVRVRSWIQKLRSREKPGWDEGPRGESTPVPSSDLPTRQELEQHLLAFPEGYQEAFLPRPLEDDKLLASGDEERRSFQEAFQRWKSGQVFSLALVGPDASGRTTFLNWVERKLRARENVARVSCKQRLRFDGEVMDLLAASFGMHGEWKSLQEFLGRLRELPKAVVLIDDAQYLLLRAIGKARVMKTFLAIVLATQDHFLWVVAFKDYSWRRADYQFGLSEHFAEVIHLSYLEEEELKLALRLRLEAGGLPLSFEKDGESPAGPDAGEAEAQQQAGLDRCTPELFSLSGGNMHAALFYWALSTRYDRAHGTVIILPCRGVDLAFLRDLEDLHRFSLAELLVHGGLTADSQIR